MIQTDFHFNPMLASASESDKIKKLAQRIGHTHYHQHDHHDNVSPPPPPPYPGTSSTSSASSFTSIVPPPASSSSYSSLTVTITPGLSVSNSNNLSHNLTFMEELREVYCSLSLSEQDYIIESETQRLTEKVVNFIKINRELSERIEEMDGNIGLLVRNSRLALDDQALKRIKSSLTKSSARAVRKMANSSRTNNGPSTTNTSTAKPNYLHDIFNFNRDYCRKLQSYQHLFYALQTQPRYLARLLFTVPSFQVASFFKNCIYSLFFCHPTEREVYLLCRLLREALREEIRHKVTKPTDIIEGDPVIITITLDCHRAHRQALFDAYKPVILEILSHNQPILCLDPVALYKDRCLSSSGEVSGNTTISSSTNCNPGAIISSPCIQNCDEKSSLQEITIEKALSDRLVQEKLAQNIPLVIRTCDAILDIMLSSEFIEMIPFGLRYICKHLDKFLAERSAPFYTEDDRVRVIANVIFSRWIRPCILFPEAYLANIRDVEKRTSLKGRRNLGGVCKLLQASASGKKVFTFSSTLSGSTAATFLQEVTDINAFLDRSWTRFKQLVDLVCCVEEISDFIAINEYTDESYLKPPRVTVTLQEILEAHSILFKFRQDIAPNPEQDLIDREFHQLIKDCGPPHEDLHSLLNCDASYLDSIGQDEIMSTEVTLKLGARSVNDIKITPNATIKAKQALLELIKLRVSCKDLNQVLFAKVEDDENQAFISYKNQIVWSLSPELRKHSVMLSTTGNDLSSLLDFAIANVRHTEARNFDEVVMMMTNDVIHSLQYREKRCVELQRLDSTLKDLLRKREYLQEIHQYYEKYLNKCRASYRLNPYLDRINHGSDHKPCFKYSASRLKEKGVLVSLGDIKPSQLKKVRFEIAPSPESSLCIEIRMFQRNIEIAKVKLDLQYLLRLQYDGLKVVPLLGKAHVNVNHLILFVNCKFYVKKNR
ncbi:ras GTPase-activating-like protein IQGAP3 [Brevipalpus obovatus]|uniref:ras GTPase-activating-like protein IQGAP3 n=1 Tax=Brevipalpus obovatus TaxID=246614 RepID=UPI003D9FADD6